MALRNASKEDRIYRKIQISQIDQKDTFYRVLLVDGRLTPEELAIVLGTALHAEETHRYYFIKDGCCMVSRHAQVDEGTKKIRITFTPKIAKEIRKGAVFMSGLETLDDLGSTFKFMYESRNDPWLFQCRLYKAPVVCQATEMALVEDGEGYGIIEGAAAGFEWYFDCDPIIRDCPSRLEALESSLRDEALEYVKGLNLEKFRQFDKPLDLLAEQTYFDSHIGKNYCSYYQVNDPEKEIGVFSLDRARSIRNGDGNPGKGDTLNNPTFGEILQYQIDNVPFVHNTFTRLLKKYDRNMAARMIAEVWMEHESHVLKQDQPYNQEDYKRALRELR